MSHSLNPLKPEPRQRRSESIRTLDTQVSGEVVKCKSDRGYGFIQTEQGNDVFVHVKSIAGYPRVQELLVGQAVLFDLAPGQSGKPPVAINVRPV